MIYRCFAHAILNAVHCRVTGLFFALSKFHVNESLLNVEIPAFNLLLII